MIPRLRPTLTHRDYFTQALTFAWPRTNTADHLDATVTVTQPYGFAQTLTASAERSDGRGEIVLDYPLVDEGRYASRPSKDAEGRAPWGMGVYRFDVELSSNRKTVATGVVNLDPNSFFGEIGGMRLAQVDSVHQFIECASERPAFIDTTTLTFTIRTLPERVRTCDVEVDVVRPRKPSPVVEPIRLSLRSKVQRFSFDATGWARGEYWLRVKILRDENPVGPFLVPPGLHRNTSRRRTTPESPSHRTRPPVHGRWLVFRVVLRTTAHTGPAGSPVRRPDRGHRSTVGRRPGSPRPRVIFIPRRVQTVPCPLPRRPFERG